MMIQILWAVAAIWGLSAVIVTVLFVIDERSFRRQCANAEPSPVAAPLAPAHVATSSAPAQTAARTAAPARKHVLV
jgi:hypothetical protein